MSSTRPDFGNWSDEEFESRADEVCAYADSLDLGDVDWMTGAEYRLWLCIHRSPQSDGPSEVHLRPHVAAARGDGTSWERISKLLGISASEAQRRYADATLAVPSGT